MRRNPQGQVGRPPVAEEDRRNRLSLYATDDDRARWEAKAKRGGMTLSTWLVFVANMASRKP